MDFRAHMQVGSLPQGGFIQLGGGQDVAISQAHVLLLVGGDEQHIARPAAPEPEPTCPEARQQAVTPGLGIHITGTTQGK